MAGTSLFSVEFIPLPHNPEASCDSSFMLRLSLRSVPPCRFSSRLLLYPGGMCFSHLAVSNASSTLQVWLASTPRIGRDLILPWLVPLMIHIYFNQLIQVTPSLPIFVNNTHSLSQTVIGNLSCFWFIPFKELDLAGPFIPRLVLQI